MPFILPFLPLIMGGGGSSSSSSGGTGSSPADTGTLTDVAGRKISDKAILPGQLKPVDPALQKQFLDWIQSTVGKGMTPYNKPLDVNLGHTMLPNVWNSWAPTNAGTDAMQGAMAPGGPIQNMIASGGASPTADMYARSMAKVGYSSPQAGGPMVSLAYGAPTASASMLMPYLNGGGFRGYQAPMIPGVR